MDKEEIRLLIQTVHHNACVNMMHNCRKQWNVDMTNKMFPPRPPIDTYCKGVGERLKD